ncbi:hypothetical protein JZU46_03140 [bacterium]|nr:hypothetical protein [bacterium]
MKKFDKKVPKPEPVEHKVKYTGEEILELIKKDLQSQGIDIPEGEEQVIFSIKQHNGGATRGSVGDSSLTFTIKSFPKV